MRHEGQADLDPGEGLEILGDLGQMTMAAHRIGFEAFADFGHQQTGLGLATGAAHARLGVGDQPGWIDRAPFEQRQKTQGHSRGIAAGIGDQPRATNRVTIDFGQAVDGLGEQIRALMRHPVPALPECGIFQAEIGGQIDDARAAFEQLGHGLHRRAVGRSEEDQIALG